MFSRMVRGLARGPATTAATQRTELLMRIYEPFHGLQKDGEEYNALAQSGKVWEDWYRPSDSERYGYNRLQQKHESDLRVIDGLRSSRRSSAARRLEMQYAQQSVMIEGNTLSFEDGRLMQKRLAQRLGNLDFTAMSAAELAQLDLPHSKDLLPEIADESQVVELRNHIVASHWVTERALQGAGNLVGLGEEEIQKLLVLTLRNTASEDVYRFGWGKRVKPGSYRQSPIMVRSNPLRIFPYHQEVPACMERYYQWREKIHWEGLLHPLILACQATAYFIHIHPFPDGNGRVSRLMMQDYLVRHGYLPSVVSGLSRERYLQMMEQALGGDPADFVTSIITAQLEATKT